MRCLFKSRYGLRFLSIIILLFLLIPSNLSFADSSNWEENWSYSQEIIIPFDTSLEISKFQPVDLKIEFENPCWAKNVDEHSIRVICWNGKNFEELESQIYSLKKVNDNFITSCNMVFLIPDFADGKEKYYVYYDESEKTAPKYPKHVKIEESYYRIEPISGYALESDYYKIIDDNYLSYGVSYNGQFMSYNTCQHVMRMKQGVPDALPKNIELFAAFDFKYSYDNSLFGYSSTSQSFISKEVLIDGNLMLEFRIVSTSKFNDLKTTATYKYYHCPNSNARIHVHVKHEALKEIKVFSIPPATNTDGIYASLQCIGVISKSIQDLNIGRIFPFLHFYNEFDKISGYAVDIDPEYIPEESDIRIISYRDDVDLGKKAWISFDEGETGFAHSIIFSSNDVLVSGTNKKEGLQISAFELDYPHLPGLENNIATIEIGRNSFESGGNHDLIIPSDFVAEFDAEFFSSDNNGYLVIEKEAEIFQELVKLKPIYDKEINEDFKELVKYNLSVIVHNTLSIPFGSSLSVFLGLNLSYINVELFQGDEFIYSENAVRLPMNPINELEDPSVIKRIISALNIFDCRNFSIIKKAVFSNINPGKYIIKIFKENQLLSEEKQFIGYAIVDLQKDQKVHVYCRSEASIDVTVLDQNNEKVENAVVTLEKDNLVITKGFTDENGQITIKAPTNIELYVLKIFYNGLNVYEESVKLGVTQKIIRLEKIVDIQRYTLNLKIVDTWGQAPNIELNPTITSTSITESNKISARKIEYGNYVFTNLTPSTYLISLNFKSFTLNENVDIFDNKNLELEFPAEYDVNLKIFNSRGMPYENSKIIISRNDDKLEIQAKESHTIITIPPGEYQVEVFNENKLISSRTMSIYGTQDYDLITTDQPVYLAIIMILCAIIITISLIFFGYKKQYKYFFITIGIILIILALFLPWWEINGSINALETSTNLYLFPNKMITMTTLDDTIAGEPSYLPSEFLIGITVLISLAIIGCILIPLNIYLRKKGKKRLEKISKIIATFSVIGPILIFIIAMNELSKATVGSIIGNGYLDVGVPGESQFYSVMCNWGLSIGFYLYVIAVLIIIIISFNSYLKNR